MSDCSISSPKRPPPRSVSVAGSQDSTSTSAMIAALLTAAGARTGRIDAGFVQSSLERLSIDGRSIDAGEATALVAELEPEGGSRSLIDRIAGAFFERGNVDWLVQSVNPPVLSNVAALAWTPIVAAGSRSPAEEARRLVGQAPATRAVVAAPQRESVLDLLRAAYPAMLEVAKLCAMSRGRTDLDGQEMLLRTPVREYRLKLALLGRYQLANAATAILTVEQLASEGLALTEVAARSALGSLRLPGRLEPIKRRPLMVVDVAETPAAMRRLAETLRSEIGLRRPTFILAATRDADLAALVAPLIELDPDLVLTTTPAGEGAEPTALAQACLDAGLQMPRLGDPRAALDEALAGDPGQSWCIAGPRELIAAARAHILGLMPPGSNLD